MVGFTLVSRSYYYLRRRSPGPPFPPDHRQAGERGAINYAMPRCAWWAPHTQTQMLSVSLSLLILLLGWHPTVSTR